MAWFDDFMNAFGGGESVTSGTVSLAPFVLYLMIGVAVLLISAGVIRKIARYQHFKSIGVPLFPVRIIWEEKYSGVEGYLSRYDLFTNDVFETLSREEGVIYNTSIIKQLHDEGRLNVYFLNVSYEGDTDDVFNKTFIISPYKLEDLGWWDTKGKRYAYSWFDRIRRKNIFLLKTSTKYTISPDGKEEDWWIVSPKTVGKTGEFVGFRGDKSLNVIKHVFESSVLEGGRKLSEESSYVKFFVDALNQNEYWKKMCEIYKKLSDESVVKLIEKQVKSERWKFGLTQKHYIVLTKEMFERQTGINAIWMAVAGILTGIMGYIMPDIIPQLREDTAMMVGWIIGIVIVVALFKVLSDQQKKTKFNEDGKGEDM